MNKSMKIVFSLSLALNLLLIGLIAGHLLHQSKPFRTAHNSVPAIHSKWLQELPPDLQTEITTRFQQRYTLDKPLHNSVRENRRKAATLLTAEVFDAETYKATMNRLNADRKTIMDNMTALTSDLAIKLPPEQRKVLIKALKKPHFGRSSKGKRDRNRQ